MKMPRMEKIVRPFALVSSFSRVRAESVETDNREAFIRWGGPSEFLSDAVDFRDTAVNHPGFDIKDDDDGPLSKTYYEKARVWEDFEVTNPEDTTQSIIIRRSKAILFAAPTRGFITAGNRVEEQVLLNFTNGLNGQPVYENTSGEEFSSVSVDPFTSIVEVNWSGHFVLITTAMRGSNVQFEEGGPVAVYVSILDTIGIKVPDLGVLVDDASTNQYPADAESFNDVIVKHMGDWEFNDEDQPPDGAFTSGQMWMINMSALFKRHADDIIATGTMPIFSMWFSHVAIPVNGVMRVSVYSASGLKALETFQDPLENPLDGLVTTDQVMQALAPENFLPALVDKQKLVAALHSSFDKNYAVGAGAGEGPFNHTNRYDFRWDYLNRGVQGVLPQVVSTA